MFNSSGSQNMSFSIWNFFFFFWSLYVPDDSGMKKDLCLFTKRDLPCGEWHSLHFPKCIISCPLFHDPFETPCVSAPHQQGVSGTCITTAIQITHLNYSWLNTFQEQLTILMNITINSALLRNCTFTKHENDYTVAFREGQQGMPAAVGQ